MTAFSVSRSKMGSGKPSPFFCHEPGCHKSFKRKDHLVRHRQNHIGNNIHPCRWPNCKKSFVRKDVMLKHFQRHMSREAALSAKKKTIEICEIQTPHTIEKRIQKTDSTEKSYHAHKSSSDDGSTASGGEKAGPWHMSESGSELDGDVASYIEAEKEGDAKTPNINEAFSIGYANVDNDKGKFSQEGDIYPKSFFESENTGFSPSGPSQREFRNSSVTSTELNMDGINSQIGSEDMFWSDMIHLMLNNNMEHLNEASLGQIDHIDHSPSFNINDILSTTPQFPQARHQTEVSEFTRSRMVKLIPCLNVNPDFGIIQIERCLAAYWSSFHIQYPIIHKPSFSTMEVNPLLLLSMIAIGSALISNSDFKELMLLENAHKLSDDIARPLRWLLCSASEFALPIKAWVMQSLLILESYEICCSDRALHQRAYLHHGLKIQLLRRSPLLGGNPHESSSQDEDVIEEQDAWRKWIEIESLKRCALMAFSIDTYHAIIFGHETTLFAHQIKLSLPCDEIIWEMTNVYQQNLPPQSESPRFLTVLSKVLRREKFITGPFGRKILLAGLLAIAFQIDQKDNQLLMLENKHSNRNYKDSILKAIDYWMEYTCNDQCCDSRKAFHNPSIGDSFLPSMLNANDKGCKFAVYHISQVFLRLRQYDCIIYAGAPSRMNVKTVASDYATVKKRIKQWALSQDGKISVCHAYIFIAETLLCQDDNRNMLQQEYDPSKDPIFYRPNIVASLLFVIWSYNYSLEGPESNLYVNHGLEYSTVSSKGPHIAGHQSYLGDTTFLPERLQGYDYIKAIRRDFLKATGTPNLSSKHVGYYAKCIDQIPGKNRTVGLLRLFAKNFKKSESKICKEYGNLLENCILRSMGKLRMTCDNMYD